MPEEDAAMTHDPEENNSMHSLEERYQKEPVARLMFSMALPQVAAQLVNLLYSIVDRVYIGHIIPCRGRRLAPLFHGTWKGRCR